MYNLCERRLRKQPNFQNVLWTPYRSTEYTCSPTTAYVNIWTMFLFPFDGSTKRKLIKSQCYLERILDNVYSMCHLFNSNSTKLFLRHSFRKCITKYHLIPLINIVFYLKGSFSNFMIYSGTIFWNLTLTKPKI